LSKVTESAKGENCTIRLPGHCNFNPETTVFCHINGIRFNHGVGYKTKFGAYGCSSCHDVVDGRAPTELSRDYVKLCHYEGVFETMLKLEKKGYI
jgi:hypothetical protein